MPVVCPDPLLSPFPAPVPVPLPTRLTLVVWLLGANYQVLDTGVEKYLGTALFETYVVWRCSWCLGATVGMSFLTHLATPIVM